MAFNPISPLFFPYIQFSPQAPSELVSADVPQELSNINNIQILSLPPWLNVQNTRYESSEGKIYFDLVINSNYTDSITAGDYSASIRLRYRATVLGIATATITSEFYNVLLTVITVIPLELSPTTLPFNFLIGGPPEQNKTLNITSESNWTIISSQNWVTLSQTTGFSSGQVFVGVDPTGLTVGQYSASLTVQDATSTRIATVTLNVNEGDTDTDFLFISPQNLQFLSVLSIVNETSTPVSIDASGNWSAVASESWINLSVNSGGAGITSINISVDSVALTDLETPYLGQITFTQQNLQKIIYVELFLVEFLRNGIESETLYFADDRNKFSVTNIIPNMSLYLEGTLNNGIQNIIYKLSAPYQNGLAKVLFGLETNVMLRSVIPTNNFITRIKNNIRPVVINFLAYNKRFRGSGTIPLERFSNVRFLTGKTPVITNKLCYIPNLIHVTKNAVLSLSCLSEDLVNEIIITGDVTGTINSGIADNVLVYNAVINLSDFNLQVGNKINIASGSVSVDVLIKEDGIDHNIVAFENEWREYEFAEFTGRLQIEAESNATETELQNEGTKITKTVSIDSGKGYTLDTGHIYSQAEMDWISKILESRRIFIYEDGEPVEIVLTTKRLVTYETRTHYRAFKLKFKKAIVA